MAEPNDELSKFELKIVIKFPRSINQTILHPKAEIALKTPDGNYKSMENWDTHHAVVYGSKLLAQSRIPRKLKHKLVYVVAGTNPECEYVVFDALKTIEEDDERPTTILPAMFDIVKPDNGDVKRKDTFREQLKDIADLLTKKFPKAAMSAGWVEHTIDIVDLQIGKDIETLECRDKVKWRRHPLGEYARLLPTPELSDPDKLPKHGAVIGRLHVCPAQLGSFLCCESVWSSLRQLSEILEPGKSQTILIHGPPGSGKELFSNALHYGALRPKRGEYLSRSLAGASLTEARTILLGAVTERGAEIEGLIAKAHGGTLFIDEFDKAQDLKQLGGLLLRILEAKEYLPEGGQQLRKVDDVNWIFAGAFQSPELEIGGDKGPPSDLASRFSGYLQLENSLQEEGYPAAQFLYWHISGVIEWLGKKNWYDALVKGEGDFKVRVARRALGLNAKNANDDPDVLEPGQYMVTTVANLEKAMRAIEKEGKVVSVRSIRQASGILTHYITDQLIKNPNSSINDLEDKLLEKAGKALRAASVRRTRENR